MLWGVLRTCALESLAPRLIAWTEEDELKLLISDDASALKLHRGLRTACCNTPIPLQPTPSARSAAAATPAAAQPTPPLAPTSLD